jgi:hypothetical protein
MILTPRPTSTFVENPDDDDPGTVENKGFALSIGYDGA